MAGFHSMAAGRDDTLERRVSMGTLVITLERNGPL